MKLIIAKRRRTGYTRGDKNTILISKYSISVRSGLLQTLGCQDQQCFFALGYNDKDRLTAFITREPRPEFYCLTGSNKKSTSSKYVGVTEINREAILPLLGEYNYQQPILKNGIWEVVLLKKTSENGQSSQESV